jgi:hypothetical protein
MIAAGNAMHSQPEKFFCGFGSQAETAGSVFSINNDKINVITVNQPVDLPGKRLSSRPADYIPDEEQLNGHIQLPVFHG